MYTIILTQWCNMTDIADVYLDFPSSLITQTRRFKSTLLSKRRVCVISDDGKKVQIHISDISHFELPIAQTGRQYVTTCSLFTTAKANRFHSRGGGEEKGRTTGQTAGVTLCCWVNGSRHFEGTYRLHKTRNRPRSCLPTSILALRPARCPRRSSTSIRSKRLAHCGLNVSLSCQLPLSEYEHTTDSIRGLSCANTSY